MLLAMGLSPGAWAQTFIGNPHPVGDRHEDPPCLYEECDFDQGPLLQFEFLPSGAVRLWWDAGEPDWILEGSLNLRTWEQVLPPPEVQGGAIVSTTPFPAPTYFWRLRPQRTSGAAGGRGFLIDRQEESGFWGGGTGTETVQSTSALEALLLFRGSDPALEPVLNEGMDAVFYSALRSNDALSRAILALAGAGRSVPSLVDTLLAAQNPEIDTAAAAGYPGFGWGAASGFGDTALDTALALRALRSAGYAGGLSVVGATVAAGQTGAAHSFEVPPGATDMELVIREVSANARFNLKRPDSTVSFFDAGPGQAPIHVTFGDPMQGTWTMQVESQGAPVVYSAEVPYRTAEGFDVGRLTGAASFLGFAQNADGGWGLGPGLDSHLLVTCEVMRTLAGLGSGFSQPLAAGADWLQDAKRNADGGFSSEPGTSDLLETAMAVVAIRASGRAIDLGTARAFLEAGQALDGGWEGDVHLTALAAQAVAEPPVLSPVPDQEVLRPEPFAPVRLDDYVADPDHADAVIRWTVTGQNALSVVIEDRVATVSYPADIEISEDLTFTATDPDGLSASVTATFGVSQFSPVDYTIARGGLASGNRSFTADQAVLDQVAFYTESVTGLPAGVSYSTTTLGRIGPDRMELGFRIDVGQGADLGQHEFSIEYGLLDAGQNPLGPLSGNVFTFTIRITP